MPVTIETSFVKQTFDHRINFINGLNDVGDNSGTRKTYFFKRLREERTAGTLVSNYNPVFIDDITNMTNFAINDGDVIILDEANFKPSLLRKLYDDMKTKDVYLILIGRLTSNINCNFETIYFMTEFTEDRITLEKMVDS